MTTKSPNLASITFFQFPAKNRFWIFKQMGRADSLESQFEGTNFVRLLGTGAGFGFDLWPDFSTYALLIHWVDPVAAGNMEQNPAFKKLLDMANSHETHWMQCAQVHGSWNGSTPFSPTIAYEGGPIITLTRARISWRHMWNFLKAVRFTVRDLQKAPGLIFSIGIGQTPLVEQATFSIWENVQAMEDYAYRSRHREVLHVSQKNWFKEELFGRFVPVDLEEVLAVNPTRADAVTN